MRGESDREEGDRRQRRRRRGEVDSDELPTLIIWENVARRADVTRCDRPLHGRLDRVLIHILILISPKINKKV